MDFSDYETVFRDSEIKSWLDWDLVNEAKCRVREIYSRSAELLSGLHTVWYRAPDGTNGDWRNQGDRPLRIGEVSTTRSTWPAERQARMKYFMQELRKLEHPLLLVLPAYSPNDHDTILLDGTHRAAAAYLGKVQVRLMIFTIMGPCDARILPDLKHYSD